MAPVRIKHEVDPDIPPARPTTAADTVGGLSATAGVGVRIKQEMDPELDTTRTSTTLPVSASVPSVQVKMENGSGVGAGASRTSATTTVKRERGQSGGGDMSQEHTVSEEQRKNSSSNEDIICVCKVSYTTGKRLKLRTIRCVVPDCLFFINKHDFGTYDKRNQHYDDEHPGFREFYYSEEQIKRREEAKQEKLEAIAAEREMKKALKLARREKEEARQKKRKEEAAIKKAQIQRELEQKSARRARAKLRAERKEKKAAAAREKKDKRARKLDEEQVNGEIPQPAVQPQPVPEIVFKEFQFNPSTKLLTRSVIVEAYEEGGRSIRKTTTTTVSYEYDDSL